MLKKLQVLLFVILLTLFFELSTFFSPLAFAGISKTQYYDFGPYYNNRVVLGISLSSLEQLPVPSLPQNVEIGKASGILPGNPLYAFDALIETVQLATTFDPVKKEDLRLQFAQERLSEARQLLDQKRDDLASTAVSSYQSTITTVSQNTQDLVEKKVAGASEFVSKVDTQVAANAVAAQTLALASTPVISQKWGEIVDSAERSMDILSDVSNKPPIPQALSNSIQELKQQGLITEEESKKLYSFSSRSEVREELDKLADSGQFPAAEVVKLNESVENRFPETFKETADVFRFAELRTYQTFPVPSTEIQTKISEWKEKSDTLPPPEEIRPYLYHQRAEILAKEIDFTNFKAPQHEEVAKFYPEAVSENETLTLVSPTPSPSISPTPTVVQPQTNITPGQPAPTSSPVPTQSVPTPLPTAVPPTADPYLLTYKGPVPGDGGYIFKQWGEGISLFTTFDQKKKLELNLQFAQERLKEASLLAKDTKKEKLYEESLKKYKDELKNASEQIEKFTGSKEDKFALAKTLESSAARHNIVFEKGLLPSPEDKKILTEVIEATENALDKSADTLDRPALPQALSVRLQDLKAQGIILPEEVDVLTKADSREEVRTKIRELAKQGFPPADAKKLDEAQSFVSPQDYNQLVEVKKVEELQRLRAVQAEFAQTATLKATNESYKQQVESLENNIDPSIIKPEDLAGKKELLETYNSLIKTAPKRPINGGQFGKDVLPNVTPTPGSEKINRSDAVLTTCPIGATFKQFEGCVWENGKKINDYDQYKCDKPGQYYSFAAKKCLVSEIGKPFQDDAKPVCPLGYNWSWETQSCQAFTGGGLFPTPYPTISPVPTGTKPPPGSNKFCPQGARYEVPSGCVWEDTGKSITDSEQYRCGKTGQYYSFEKKTCVDSPKPGDPYDNDAQPKCANGAWSWTEGKCIEFNYYENLPWVQTELKTPAVTFVPPDNPFYFLKRGFEAVQDVVSITPKAREEARLTHAKERFAEAYYNLEKKKDEEGFKKYLADYTSEMQKLYNDLSKNPNISAADKKDLGQKLESASVEQNLLLQKASVLSSADLAAPISGAVSVVVQGVDRASDLKGENAIPAEIKEKIDALPEGMIKEEDKKKLEQTNSRVEARLELGKLVAIGVLTQADTAVLDEGVKKADPVAIAKLDEIKKLNQITDLKDQSKTIGEKVEKTENIVKKLDEFQKKFAPGEEVPAEIRPYVGLTRIEEITKTIRPDVVRLEDFGNRKDVVLAVATLKEEFKPTRESIRQVEEYRRLNPGRSLPYDLARIEALSYGLGVRDSATPCYLPSPPFPSGTPCPAPGAAIPISSLAGTVVGDAIIPIGYEEKRVFVPSLDKDGNPLVYGKGPKSTGTGVCPNGYHWMYDSGGWCMSNSGRYDFSPYGSPYSGNSSPGYTPYSPYYNATGVPSTTSGYSVGDYSPNDGCPYGYDTDGRGNCIPNSYPATGYTPPSYYGVAPTSYTTNPPAGTVPGTGPAPTSPGQCPSGFHWMPPSFNQSGWCMADAGTYVPSSGTTNPYSYTPGTSTSNTPPPEGYNCGSQAYDPVTKRCKDGACPGGFNWDGSKCVVPSPNLNQSSCGPGYYWSNGSCFPNQSGGSSSSSYQYGCTPGYYWNGSKCVAGSYEGSGWSDSAARSGSYCQSPSSGCGSNSYWDYGTCSCRSQSTYYGGAGPSPSNYCQGVSCGSGFYLDYGSCTCRSNWSSSSSSSSSGGCQYPTNGCGGSGSWYDWSSCSCRSSTYSGSSTGGSTYSGSSGGYTGSCSYRTCGSNEWFDYGTCSCRSSSSTYTPTYSGGSTGTTSSCSPPSGGCPGGWYDYGSCSCRTSSTTTSGSTGSTGGSTGSTSSSSGSCPSGYHWMSDSGGWCMSDGGSGGSSSTTTTTTTTSEPSTTTTSPSPSDSGSTTTTTTSTTTTTESSPAPSSSTTTSSPPPSDSGSTTTTTTTTTGTVPSTSP